MTEITNDRQRMKPVSVTRRIRSSRRPFIAMVVAASISLALQGCSSATTTAGSSAGSSSSATVVASPSSQTAASAAAPIEWSYSGDTGPDQWGEMVPTCQSGASSSQSPINIDPASLVPQSPVTAGTVTLHYTPEVFEV